jgi:hypothetical protein
MTPGKVFAAAYCVGVLAAQAWAIWPTTDSHAYYWPFIDYPMYSWSFDRGERISHARMMLQPCDRTRSPAEMTFRDAHLTRHEFQDRVLRAAGARNASANVARRARISLARLAHEHGTVPTCRMEVWMQFFRIGANGLELPGSGWTPSVGWDISDGVVADSAGTGPVPSPP